jgi:hypothetical protein
MDTGKPEFSDWLKDRYFDVILVDGDHSFEGCLWDFIQCIKCLKKDGWIILHDITSDACPGVGEVFDFGQRYFSKSYIYSHSRTCGIGVLEGPPPYDKIMNQALFYSIQKNKITSQMNAKSYQHINKIKSIIKWTKNKDAGYQPASKDVMVDGRQFPDSYFLFFGDGYLADPTRTWRSMSGDEFHSFLQRIVRVYGWEPFKAWYRTYSRFQKMGLKEPDTEQGKIQLMAAILSYEIGVDLVPTFQRWRLPVTQEDIDAMMKKYPIDQKSVK